ncbi:MAG: translocation/assembly module TamB domain-containing protein [Gammaproteobacteria bacterium]|nr:translocation/assembly module TamB domain-containing protein [Gammaproteobacteria bacterium]
MIKIIFNTLVLFIFSMCCFIAYCLLFTTTGLITEVDLIKKYLPGKLSIQTIQGSLFSQFKLQNIRYTLPDQSTNIRIKSLGLKWEPAALFVGKISIDLIQLDHANISVHALPNTSSHETSFKLPAYVKRFIIKHVEINQFNADILKNQLYLTGDATNHWNLTWHANIPNLSQFMPNLKGALKTSGKISGPLLTPVITSQSTIHKFKLGEQKASSIEINTHIYFQPDIQSRVSITANELILEGQLIKKLYLPLAGSFHKNVSNDSMTLKSRQFEIPPLGITLRNILMHATIQPNHIIQFNGEMSSGKGKAQFDGNLDKTMTLNVKGENFSVIASEHYHMKLSPNLKIHFSDNQLNIQGKLNIPEATIQLKNPNNLVTLSDDVVFVEQKHLAPALPFNVTLQLTIELGQSIHIAYQDLETDLSGHLQLQQVANGALTAVGELSASHGTYEAYGQTLKITTGRLIYTGGSFYDPGLNILAVKKLQGVSLSSATTNFSHNEQLPAIYNGTQTITVGIRVNGSLNNPAISLFSEPSMNRKDILSYLAFGYPQSELSAHQVSALLSMASAFGPSNHNKTASNIANKLQKTLGFTEFNVGSTQVYDPTNSTTVTTTTLAIGKQITHKLSLHYNVGLFYPVSILNLRYTINKNWSIQSENSTIDNGADVLFGIERD